MERIVLASSNQGDLVADFFCGSGTTALVAAKSGRKFITCDESFRAVHTARGRLLDTKSAFLLEQVSPVETDPQEAKHSRVHVSEDSICLETSLKLDYWEVDSNWDGKIFKSTAQAQRHVRSGELPMELKIKIGRALCIRLVTIQGRQYQLNI